MPTYTYPDPATSGEQWRVEDFTLLQRANTFTSESPYSGEFQSVEIPGARWGALLTYPVHRLAERPDVEAFWMGLRGRSGRVLMHNLARPTPRGTMRGSPTLAAAAAQFATSLSIATTTGSTLLAGDCIKVGNQFFMVRVGGTAASGVLTVSVEHPVRTGLSAGAAVTWDRPTFLAARTSDEMRMPRQGVSHPAMTIEVVEVLV